MRSALALAAWFCTALSAEEAPLDPVVVSATRAPAPALTVPTAVDRLDAADLARARPQLDLAESLARIPGVVVRERENHAQDLQLSIRGAGARATFGVRGLRLYTDGIPASAPDGQGQVAHFPLASAAHIEVLRGPFSALYGNAAGGVVVLTTAEPPAAPTLSAHLTRGADGLRAHHLGYATPFAVADGGLSLNLSDLDHAGFRDHSHATRRSEHARIHLARGPWQARLMADGFDLRAEDPQGLTAAQVAADPRQASAGALAFDTRKTVSQTQGGVMLGHTHESEFALRLTAWDGRRETAQMLSVPVAVQADPRHGGGALRLARTYQGADLRAELPLAATATLTLGVQRESSREQRRGYENFFGSTLGVFGALRRDEVNRVTGEDAYAQYAFQPAPAWHAVLGLRRSRVHFVSADAWITALNPDDSGALAFDHTTPVAGLLHRVTPHLSLYANAGRGFETPTSAELAYRDDGTAGLNDDLVPARSASLEVGLRHAAGPARTGLALFRTRTADELGVASSAGGRSVFRTQGTTLRQGLEFSLSRDLASAWHLALAWTALDARYRDGTAAGRRIPGLARHQAWAELRHAVHRDLDLIAEARASSRVYADDLNTAAAPGYATLDFAAERRWRVAGLDLRAWVRLENALDRAYIGAVIVNEANGRYYEPAPGRRALLGLHLQHAFD